jgi:hypothetical protein
MTSLVAVRTELKLCDSKHVSLFASLIDNGKLNPYKSKEVAKRKLGSQDVDYPLLGRKQTPTGLRRPFTPNDLQDICFRDLPVAREFYGNRLIYFAQSNPTHGSMETSEEDAIMQTITSLMDTELSATGGIISFPSEALEEMAFQGREAPEHLLRATMTTCTVLPGNTQLPLHHSNEGTTATTLLFGSIIWVFWPPTEDNLRILQAGYENVGDNFDEAQLEFTSSLEGGVIFLQGEGDGLRLPPYSIVMSLATKSSVLATYSEVTVQNFIAMLHVLPLLKAWFRVEIDGDRKQTQIVASILLHLDRLLNGDEYDENHDTLKLPFVTGGTLHRLLNDWDAIKDDLASLMGPADSKTMEKIWEVFLVGAVGRECRICGKYLRNKQKLMRKHFAENHWPKIKEKKRVDFLQGSSAAEAMLQTEGGELSRREVESARDLDE